MTSLQSTIAQQSCENILLEEKRYNIANNILASECAVADRLVRRRIELQDAYEELHNKLHEYPSALRVFLGLVLSCAAFFNPEKMQKARATRSDLVSINQQIARKAADLGMLLEQRSNLHETSEFNSGTYYHVCDVIEASSQHNYLFKSHLREKLNVLRSQFDLKYWPSLSAFLHEIAADAEKAEIAATDPLTATATTATRPSNADFIKALLVEIEENSVNKFGRLPEHFRLTDRTLASLVNCALDLNPDELVDDAYIKRFRQRERGRHK